MSDLIDLIDAIAWPVVAAVGFFLFRRPLRDALDNATQVRIAGQEIQIGRERLATLDGLIKRMEEAEGLRAGETSPLQQRILDRAEADPQIALADLESSISAAVDYLARANGWVGDLADGPSDLWFRLLQVHRLSESQPETLPALFLYSELQDAALNGALKASRSDTLRIVRFGLRIHAYLTKLPARVSTVLDSGLPVFADAECTMRRGDVDAVLIRTERMGEPPLDRVWPCTRTYEPGTRVTWTFDESHSWPTSWWRKADGEIVRVWKGTRYSFDGEPLKTPTD